jgi:uncharacterized phage protein gp47/JayE
MQLFYPIPERTAKALIASKLNELDPTLVLQRGSVADLILNSVGSVSANFQSGFLAAARMAAISTAEDEYLDEWGALIGFGRNEATKAAGEVTFSRDTAATADWDIPTGTQIGTAPDASGDVIVFVTTEDAVLATGETSVTVAAEARVAGTAGNVRAGTITNQVTPLSFAPYVTNASVFSDGTEQENDTDYRARILQGIKNNTGKTSINGYERTILSLDNVDSVLIKTGEEYQYSQWDCEATTGWATTGNAGTLATSTDEYKGTYALSFAKTSGTALAGIKNTFSATDFSKLRGRIEAMLKFSSLANAQKVASVSFILTDNTAKTLTTIAVGTPTELAYSRFYGDFDTPDSMTSGFDLENVVSLEVRIQTKLATDTFTGTLVDDVKIKAKPNQINIYFTVSDTPNGIPTETQIANALAEVTSESNKAPADDIEVYAPTAIEIDVTAVLTLVDGYDSETVITAVEENLTNYINAKPAGGSPYLTQIDSVIQGTDGVLTFSRTTPSANITTGDTEKIVVGTLDIT